LDICWSIISVSLEKNSLDIVKKCSFTRINVNAFERVTWAVTLFFQWGVQSPSRRRETPAASSSSLTTWSSFLLPLYFFGPLRIYHKRAGWLVLSFKRHRRLPLLTAGLFGKGLTKRRVIVASKYRRCAMMHAPTITCAYFVCIPSRDKSNLRLQLLTSYLVQ